MIPFSTLGSGGGVFVSGSASEADDAGEADGAAAPAGEAVLPAAALFGPVLAAAVGALEFEAIALVSAGADVRAVPIACFAGSGAFCASTAEQ